MLATNNSSQFDSLDKWKPTRSGPKQFRATIHSSKPNATHNELLPGPSFKSLESRLQCAILSVLMSSMQQPGQSLLHKPSKIPNLFPTNGLNKFRFLPASQKSDSRRLSVHSSLASNTCLPISHALATPPRRYSSDGEKAGRESEVVRLRSEVTPLRQWDENETILPLPKRRFAWPGPIGSGQVGSNTRS